ncbi:RteC domain-containing protein [Chitinophaga sp. OAE865]|uniref:RteC domain-containing protein n=1 Tax=Chitinophaga sp. OAE865 TaxID=2817898 RepID=UPI001AE14D35
MATNPQALLRMMNTDLKCIASRPKMTALAIAELSLINASGHLLELKAQIRRLPLKKIKEQVLFFKLVQPQYFCALLYYQFICSLERNKPVASTKQHMLYYHDALRQVNHYLDSRQHFAMYHKLDCRYLDKILFTLPPDDLSVYPQNGSFHYTEYFSFFSYCKAKVMAYERLQLFLSKAVKSGAARFRGEKKKTKKEPEAKLKKITKWHLKERDEILAKIGWLEMKTEARCNIFYNTLKSCISRKNRRVTILESITTILQKA